MTSCKVRKDQSRDLFFNAKTEWLKSNGYWYNGVDRYWTKHTHSREAAVADLSKIIDWSEWAVFMTPVNV